MIRKRRRRKKRGSVDRERVEKLLDQGWSGVEIARRLHISPSAVSKIKYPNYQQLYMRELRKLIHIALQSYRAYIKRQGWPSSPEAKRIDLLRRDEHELRRMYEDIVREKYDRWDNIVAMAYEASEWALAREMKNDWVPLTPEEQTVIAESHKNWIEDTHQQLALLHPKRRKPDFSKLKV
jgi:DNA-binding CsgD family transcriptional regulator